MKMPSREAQLCRKMLNVEVQLGSKMPGSLIPTWAKKYAEQVLTPGRLTPARYRFSAAAADNAAQVTPNMVRCPQISPERLQKAIFASIHTRPIVCREVLSHQGNTVHLLPRHSSRTCKIPLECASMQVQSAASLQRFASGSDAGTSLIPAAIIVPLP